MASPSFASSAVFPCGLRRLSPQDDYLLLWETDSSPMHIGALVVLERRGSEFYKEFYEHIAARLLLTPLQSRLAHAPDGYDSHVWQSLPTIDILSAVSRFESSSDLSVDELRKCVASLSITRLNVTRAPFELVIFDRIQGDRCAFYLKVHHALTDGIGFQTILHRLSDAETADAPRNYYGELPSAVQWRALSEARFSTDAAALAEYAARRGHALAALRQFDADPATRRAQTPVISLSGPTSRERAYTTFSEPLVRIKAIGKCLGATINDVLLVAVSTALRGILIERGELPPTPLVLNSARSYRRAEHGEFGNRIVSLHPHLATHVADPIKRLRAIQQSMSNERARTGFDEILADQPEKPFGPRDRRKKFAERFGKDVGVLPGNVSLSNVPGPAERLSYAGRRQLGNFPVPVIGAGRFLNITSRRNAEQLDFGVMVDPKKISDGKMIARFFRDALENYDKISL